MKYKTFTMCQWLFWNLYILSLTNPPNMGFPGGSDGKEAACPAGKERKGKSLSPVQLFATPWTVAC